MLPRDPLVGDPWGRVTLGWVGGKKCGVGGLAHLSHVGGGLQLTAAHRLRAFRGGGSGCGACQASSQYIARVLKSMRTARAQQEAILFRLPEQALSSL